MPLHANYEDVISPSERVKRNTTRRWSDSPTLLRGSQSQSDRALSLSAGHELTQSLHDLSNPRVHPVSKMLAGSQINLSNTTLQSERTSKSRDSGFNKSASCVSLNSTNSKYSHVESKVKKYVQSIKEAEALRRKSMSTDCVNNFVPEHNSEENQSEAVDRDVDQVINKMQSELKDKDMLIDALQGSYDDLLLKYAEAENKIDRLRIRSLHSSPNKKYRSSQKFSDEFEFKSLLLSNHMPHSKREFHQRSPYRTPEDGLDDSLSFTFSESSVHCPSLVNSKSDASQPCRKEVVISAPLGPVQKLYSTSVRLDKVLPSLGQLSPKSEASKSVHEMQASPHQLPVVAEDPCDSKADHEECSGLVKYNATADTGNFCHATTDTGIEDCVQSMTDNNTTIEDEGRATASRLSLEPELKRILNIPGEDAIAKVQRWRESLPDDVIGQKKEATSKPKKQRSKKPVLPKKTVGVQTCSVPGNIGTTGYSNNDSLHSQTPAWCKMRESSYLLESVESLEITDYDNCSSEMNHKFCRGSSRSPAVARLRQESSSSRNKPSGVRNKHQCCGECKTCGRVILAPDRLSFEASSSLSLSGGGPKDKTKAPHRKAKSGFERTERNAIRRDLQNPWKGPRCLRPGSSGAYLTRAILLDMLLSAQTAHSCCGCCQHTWRGRPVTPFSGDFIQGGSRSSAEGGNSLLHCLDEIQEIAWELKDNLAASHERLANLVRKSD